MIHKRYAGNIFCATLIMLAASGCARDPLPGTPEATAEGNRLMHAMSDLLAGTMAFRFATDESLEPLATTPDGKILYFSRTATVRRPDAMFFELGGSGETSINVSASYDGSMVSLRDNATGAWAQTPAADNLDDMLDHIAWQFSLPVPIADVVYSTHYEAFVGPDSIGGFVARENIDGIQCSYLVYEDDYVDVHIWLPSSGQPLPRRLELVYKQAPGAPKARIDFTSWDLEPQVNDEVFVIEPGQEADRMAFEDFVAVLLSGDDPGSEQ